MINESGKVFSVTCSKTYQIYIYNIERYKDGKFTLEKLDFIDEIVDTSQYRRIFHLTNPLSEGNDLLVVTIKDKKISISRYILHSNTLKVQKNIENLSYEVLVTDYDSEFDFQYIKDMKKSICVFDVNNKCEVIPSCFYSNREKIIKGRFKLGANKKYLVLKLEKKDKEKSA